MLDTISYMEVVNDYNFEVEEQPVYDQLGNVIEGHKAVVRLDTNENLGLHGSRYKIVNHQDVVDSVID